MASLRSLVIPVLLCAVVAVHPAGGQQVVGVVRESASGAPIPGAVVSLVDGAGTASARTIADREGRFALPVVAASRTVQARRIGFRPFEVALPDSAHRARAPIEVRMEPVPRVLDPVVAAGAGCPSTRSGPQGLALWEQARSAFLATIVARDAAPAALLAFSFALEAPDKVITIGTFGIGARAGGLPVGEGALTTAVTARVEQRTSTRPWVAGRSPGDFVTLGYVDMAGAVPHLYGPDADALLDPSFERTHCFSVADRDDKHPRQIGVAFRPAAGREAVTDIQGTLWMDEAPLGLRTLEFTYVGRHAAEDDRSGGWISFRTADNGVVLIEEWTLHYPAQSRGVSMIAMGRTPTAVGTTGPLRRGLAP